jgi:hypothetical protein
MAFTGGCRCGAVRYRLDEDRPVQVRICWCRECQKAAGGSSAVNAMFPTARLAIEGEMVSFGYVADSGTPIRQSFCPACGTPLFAQAETRQHMIAVRVGSLDAPAAVRPQMVIWASEAPDWASIDPDLPRYDGQPPPIPQ